MKAADADPAVDLVALGPIFSTTSKENPDPVVGLRTLSAARELTEKPLIAIGGLSGENLSQAALFERLENLDRELIRTHVGPWLEGPEHMTALLTRWRGLVKHFQELAERRGRAAVLLD